MIEQIKNMLFPCERTMQMVLYANKKAHEKLMIACGKGDMSPLCHSVRATGPNKFPPLTDKKIVNPR